MRLNFFRLSLFGLLLTISAWISAEETGFTEDYPGVESVGQGEVALRRIHPDVWLHISTWRFENGLAYPSNGLVVRQGDELFLVDPAWGKEATKSLLKAIEEQIGLPVRFALSTHFHDDRVAGDNVLKQHGIKVYASPLTRELAAAEGNVVPETGLDGLDKAGDAVALGPVEVFYPGAGHTLDNLVVYLPDAAVLFGGCLIHEQGRDNAGNTADADLTAWPESLKRVKARYPGAEIVVPGHGVPGGMALLQHSISLVEQAGR